MKFSLADSFLNSTFIDQDDRAVYRVQSPRKHGARWTISISRILPSDIPRRATDTALDDIGHSDDLSNDRFALLAQVEWRGILSAEIRYGAEEIDTKHFFRKEAWYSR